MVGPSIRAARQRRVRARDPIASVGRGRANVDVPFTSRDGHVHTGGRRFPRGRRPHRRRSIGDRKEETAIDARRPVNGHDPAPRLLALDIDGTLLDGSGTLRTVIRDAVRHLVASGVHVVLATGRSPWYGVGDLAEELGLRGVQLTMQGALAINVPRGRRERVRGLPPIAYMDALAFAASEGIDPVVATLDGHRARHLPDGVDFLGASRRRGVFRVVRDLREVLPETPMRVFLPTSPERHRLVRLRARERFLGRASVTWSDVRGIELMAPAVNKGEALAWLAATHGYTLDETAAIGDAHNDIEMLRVAGRSAAMASAPPEVRAAAELVVPSSDEDGVVDALAAFFPDRIGVAGRTVGRLGGRGPRHRAGILSVTADLPVGSAG